MTAPEKIWADMWPYDFPGFSPCFTWHHPDSIEDGTEGLTSYVRADLYATLAAENERLDGLMRERSGILERYNAMVQESMAREEQWKARVRSLEEAQRNTRDHQLRVWALKCPPGYLWVCPDCDIVGCRHWRTRNDALASHGGQHDV